MSKLLDKYIQEKEEMDFSAFPFREVYIAVIGSRTFKDYSLLKQTLDELIKQFKVEPIIVSGGAKGADSLAKMYAIENKLQIKEFYPDWNNLDHPEARIKIGRFGRKYDANAGLRRNTQIIEEADIVVAFHNNSPGTADSLRKARALNRWILEVTF